MKLTINGEANDVPSPQTVSSLVAHLGLDGPVAVELNAQVVPRAEHGKTQLSNDDVIEIVHFVGGG